MSGVQMRDRPNSPHAHLPIDPRMAERWVSVRRDHIRRRQRTAIGVMVAVSAVAGAWVLAHSQVLAVHQVVVRGTGHTSRSGVLVAAGGLDGRTPMLDVDRGGIERRVAALPWVARVRVRRHWPTTVTIDITERGAVAQVAATAGQPAVVDTDGRVLAVGGDASTVLGGAHPALPILQGGPLVGPPGTPMAGAARAALRVLLALRAPPPGHLRGGEAVTVTSVTQADGGMVSASLAPGSISVIFGSTDELDAKVIALRSVLTQLAPGAVAGIDVRVADAPVLTGGSKSSIVSTTQRG
ncbi:MAG: FtsQ-type POTRA domain-containing protein [Actinomycetota bacterium]|nr:FtsQ-type POTRA domain-containing protein [Actinomycetota bacterium]